MLIRLIAVLVALLALVALYFTAALKWSYSTGERAGWVQKLSKKGWVCKTWEGELAMVSMPGATPEKFLFTVFDDEVAQKITKAMGQRVSLHYEEKVGLPSTCFGETRHYVTGVSVSDAIPLAPGVSVPQATAAPAPAAAPSAASAVASPAAPASAASQ
jgi:hypothetical protein